ncbi:MAG: GAF domain-containing protein [Thermoleophilia bacterium]
MDFVPVPRGGGKPKSVAMFAVDTTDRVMRSGIRDATEKISAEMMSSLDLEHIMRVVLENLATMAGANAGGLCFLEDGHWVGRIGYGEYSDELIQELYIPYEEFPSGVAACNGRQALAADDAEKDERCNTRLVELMRVKSSLIVPLVTGKKTIGAVWLTRTDHIQHFTEEQVRFATSVGSHAALAISNAKAYENERRLKKIEEYRNAELDALYQVSQSIGLTMDIEQLLQGALQTVVELDQFRLLNKGGIFMVQGDSLELVCRSGSHDQGFLDLHKGLKVGDCLCGRAAFTGEMILSTHSHEDVNHTISYAGMEDHGHVIVPLKAHDRVLGVMYLYLPAGTILDDRSRGILLSIGSQLGVAIANTASYNGSRSVQE